MDNIDHKYLPNEIISTFQHMQWVTSKGLVSFGWACKQLNGLAESCSSGGELHWALVLGLDQPQPCCPGSEWEYRWQGTDLQWDILEHPLLVLPPKSWVMQHMNSSGKKLRGFLWVTVFRFRESHSLHPVKHPIPNELLFGKPPPGSLQASAAAELGYASPGIKLWSKFR